MRNFFDTIGGLDEFQLDIVGFLAILGEGSVLANAQVSTLSKWIFVPRLLPAPQALLRPTRPSKLEQSRGWVTGVFSGNYRDYVNHIGSIVCDAESMPQFWVRCVEIERVPGQPNVKAKTVAPLTAVAALGATLSVVLLALSIHFADYFALIATVLLSLLSTLIGLGNKWALQLQQRKKGDIKALPQGDVVIRYPKGSFLVVKCDENVARELYFAPESINYLVSKAYIYRLISLVGTLMLMFGVIALGNATTELQIAFAAAYMIMNAAYWIVAALPAKTHWDTSCFKVHTHKFYGAHENKWNANANETFTQALWNVIAITKNSDWVYRNEAAPQTNTWKQWLLDAKQESLKVRLETATSEDGKKIGTYHIPEWDSQAHFGQLAAEFAAETQNGDVKESV